MRSTSPPHIVGFTFILTLAATVTAIGVPRNVTYDGRSLLIDGQRVLLHSGSIHYPRASEGEWDNLLQKAKAGGLNLIETYVFWVRFCCVNVIVVVETSRSCSVLICAQNIHEPEQGKFYFEGRADLLKFLDLCQQHGFLVNLRIGPYVCAEWNLGTLCSRDGIGWITDSDDFCDLNRWFP